MFIFTGTKQDEIEAISTVFPVNTPNWTASATRHPLKVSWVRTDGAGERLMHRAGMAPPDLTPRLCSSSETPCLFFSPSTSPLKKVVLAGGSLPALAAERKPHPTKTRGEVGIKKKGGNTCIIINVIATTTYNNAKHRYALYPISRNQWFGSIPRAVLQFPSDGSFSGPLGVQSPRGVFFTLWRGIQSSAPPGFMAVRIASGTW